MNLFNFVLIFFLEMISRQFKWYRRKSKIVWPYLRSSEQKGKDNSYLLSSFFLYFWGSILFQMTNQLKNSKIDGNWREPEMYATRLLQFWFDTAAGQRSSKSIFQSVFSYFNVLESLFCQLKDQEWNFHFDTKYRNACLLKIEEISTKYYILRGKVILRCSSLLLTLLNNSWQNQTRLSNLIKVR